MADESRRTVTTADLERCAWQQVIADAAEKRCFHIRSCSEKNARKPRLPATEKRPKLFASYST